MDGTFKVVRAPFYQVFTINIYLQNGRQVPGVYVLMYYLAGSQIKRMCFNFVRPSGEEFRQFRLNVVQTF